MRTHREHLSLEELIRAMAVLADRNLGMVVKIHSYRTHTGDPFPPGGKAAWDGPLAHEIRAELAVTENYVDAADLAKVVRDLEDLGFSAYFTAGGYDEGYLHVGIGRQGSRLFTTESEPSAVELP